MSRRKWFTKWFVTCFFFFCPDACDGAKFRTPLWPLNILNGTRNGVLEEKRVTYKCLISHSWLLRRRRLVLSCLHLQCWLRQRTEQSARRCVAVQEKGRRPPARKDLDGTRLRGCEGGEEDQCTGRLWGEGVHRLGRGLGSSVLFSSGECNSPFVLKDTFSKFFDPWDSWGPTCVYFEHKPTQRSRNWKT